MLSDDLFNDAQPDPGAGILVMAVKALEEIEDLCAVLGFESNAIVRETYPGEFPTREGTFGSGDLIFRDYRAFQGDHRGICGEFQGITEQIREHLFHPNGICPDRWQVTHMDSGLLFCD